MSKRLDWVSLIEASYHLHGTDAEWLTGIAKYGAPLLDRGREPLAWTFRCTPTTFELGSFSTSTSTALSVAASVSHSLASSASIDLTYRSGNVIATASELILPRLPKMHRILLRLLGTRAKDLLVITCLSGTGAGACLALLLDQASGPTDQEHRRWPRIAAHIGAAMRIRSVAKELSLDSSLVDAALDSGGRILDARGYAKSVDVRETLRNAVRRIERSRSHAGRSDDDQALQNWEGLVCGRWSLIDQFDSDGRRFVAAVRNDPTYHDARGLTKRERQVAEYVGLGRSSKQIAYTLGISGAAVTNCTTRAQEKLGLTSRAELVAFFAQNGLRRKLAEVGIAGDRLLIGAYPLVGERSGVNLSEAERDVIAHLVAGSTNAHISLRRGTSEHTVANQIQSIFRKLNVRSRGELVARLHGRA